MSEGVRGCECVCVTHMMYGINCLTHASNNLSVGSKSKYKVRNTEYYLLARAALDSAVPYVRSNITCAACTSSALMSTRIFRRSKRI